MAYLKLVVAPTEEPVSLEDVKSTLRVDHDDDDDRLERHISEAREWVEKRIQQKLADATWELAIDAFPSSGIDLTIGPVQSITSVKYDDVSAVVQTIASSGYSLNDQTVYPTGSWPTAYSRPNSARVQFVAGYSDADLIPGPVIAAIILKVKELYDGDDVEIAIHRLLTNYYSLMA